MGEKVPCPELHVEWFRDEYSESERYRVMCGRFDGVGTNYRTMCGGDMRLCPSSRIRAQAKEVAR
jgi:hypothetical protein